MVFKMKIVFEFIKGFFQRREFQTEEQKISFSKKTKDEIKKEVQEKISNTTEVNKILSGIEKSKRIELEFLVEILNDDPSYYSEEELKVLIEEYL